MSPSNINSFVGDLVQMAQAVEQLPKVEAERDSLKEELESALSRVQARELAIVDYKSEIAELNSRIRSLEVERDDASFRVLEAEDKANVAVAQVRRAADALGVAVETLDPPKPEPVKEPEPEHVAAFKWDDGPQAQPVTTPAQEEQGKTDPDGYHPPQVDDQRLGQPIPEAVHSISEFAGHSEGNPTAKEETTSSETASSDSAQPTVADSTAGSVDPGPALGPYFGKRYYDMPTYLSRWEWIAGGGTEEDYNWRPERQGY